MRFLADMGVSERVVRWLREQGHDAVHLRERGQQRLPNGEIFRHAVEEKRIVLTFDLDFGEIAALSRDARCGTVLFRLHDTRSSNVCARLAAVLAASSGHLERGAIISVEETRHRIRHWPPREE